MFFVFWPSFLRQSRKPRSSIIDVSDAADLVPLPANFKSCRQPDEAFRTKQIAEFGHFQVVPLGLAGCNGSFQLEHFLPILFGQPVHCVLEDPVSHGPLSEATWVEWSSAPVHEAANPKLHCLWNVLFFIIHRVEPPSCMHGLLHVELLGVQQCGYRDHPPQSPLNSAFAIEKLHCMLDFFQLGRCDKVHLVEDDHIGKLNLLDHQVDDISIICLVDVLFSITH
mmetsp:Transcript_57443/g.122200  ORF Transcript_57443/g.122200 Transcript_57443/m.122200 type:complete len:224 (-) Transcript_57443:721-1392(-)